MKLSALAFILLVVNIGILVPLVAYAVLEQDRQLLMIALGQIILGIALLIAYRVAGASARCSLCACPVMLSQSCSRNRNAKRLLGSYRTRVATAIVLTGKFTCPYCGEATLCVPRQRPGQPQPQPQPHRH
ncbi:MAG: hypothetical protein HKO57_00280 [Akkermansiaceae bacterium]|nr:hypothetical protein [Akkermansiaceae bacterium]